MKTKESENTNKLFELLRPGMQSMIDNLTNGNISEAKKRAKHRNLISIYRYLRDIGYGEHKALMTASFLKGETDWQTYCDTTK